MKKINILEETKQALIKENIPEKQRLSPLYVAAWIQDNAKHLDIIHAQLLKITSNSAALVCSMPDIIFEHTNQDSFFSLLQMCNGIRFVKDSHKGEYLQIEFRFNFT